MTQKFSGISSVDKLSARGRDALDAIREAAERIAAEHYTSTASNRSTSPCASSPCSAGDEVQEDLTVLRRHERPSTASMIYPKVRLSSTGNIEIFSDKKVGLEKRDPKRQTSNKEDAFKLRRNPPKLAIDSIIQNSLSPEGFARIDSDLKLGRSSFCIKGQDDSSTPVPVKVYNWINSELDYLDQRHSESRRPSDTTDTKSSSKNKGKTKFVKRRGNSSPLIQWIESRKTRPDPEASTPSSARHAQSCKRIKGSPLEEAAKRSPNTGNDGSLSARCIGGGQAADRSPRFSLSLQLLDAQATRNLKTLLSMRLSSTQNGRHLSLRSQHTGDQQGRRDGSITARRSGSEGGVGATMVDLPQCFSHWCSEATKGPRQFTAFLHKAPLAPLLRSDLG